MIESYKNHAKFYLKAHIVWSSGYYVSSVGDVDEDKLNNYIINK